MIIYSFLYKISLSKTRIQVAIKYGEIWLISYWLSIPELRKWEYENTLQGP